MKTNFKKIKSNSYSDKDDEPTEFKRELSPEEFTKLQDRHGQLGNLINSEGERRL